MKVEGVEFRKPKPEDHNFIMNSWLKSFKSSKWAGPLADNQYWPAYQDTVRQLLSRSNGIFFIAHPDGDPDHILAYIAAERSSRGVVVHYVYTKAVFRRMGLATALLREVLDSNTFTYTFRNSAARWIPEDLHATFDPRPARRKPNESKDPKNSSR